MTLSGDPPRRLSRRLPVSPAQTPSGASGDVWPRPGGTRPSRQTPVEGVPVMQTVALPRPLVHDLLAEPLRDQPLGGTSITVLVLLVAVAILLFQALRAVLVAITGLLAPAFV